MIKNIKMKMNLRLECIHKMIYSQNYILENRMDLISNLLELLYISRPIPYETTEPDTQMYIHYCNTFKYITIEEWNLLDKHEKERYFFTKKRYKI